MIGHSASNVIPVVASNRIGMESDGDSSIVFYGSSFITDGTGAVIAEADRVSEVILTAEFDLDALAFQRTEWGLFQGQAPGYVQIAADT